MARLLLILTLLIASLPAAAQQADAPIQQLLQEHAGQLAKPSRTKVAPTIDAIAESGLPEAQTVLRKWQDKELWRNVETGLFIWAEEIDRDTIRGFDFAGNTALGELPDDDFEQSKPNSGVRKMIGAALVKFQLTSEDVATRLTAIDNIERDAEAAHLAPLREALEAETSPTLKARAERLERILTIRFGETEEERIAAIEGFQGDLGVDLRGALNPLVTTRLEAAETAPEGPEIARVLKPGSEALPRENAYDLLVSEGFAKPRISRADKAAALVSNIDGEAVAGIQVATLDTEAARDMAYARLAEQGTVDPVATEAEIDETLDRYTFYEVFTGAPPAVALAAMDALNGIETRVAVNQAADLALDAISLGSIYFLAAIGLAITFGVMGVINMAHGEFIMMGAYTGFVVQQIVPDQTLSVILAIPLAFAVTFAAGVAMERLVIRWLYHRPLETLLATFGISIALQQIAKNIFGTQARPLTAPGWLDGSLVFNDIVSISYIRIAIFVLALVFLALFLLVMNRTRLGLEVRAVTQNPRMAASMGINPDRINMLTFGFGSGIAGIAGVAIGLYAKVTSEMGADYIVQSFMTVVVGGVGNIWGTLLGATLVGTLQKGIEWLNPSNTLAAQTYMILFIILFIQFRPRGIIALKGRAAGA
ncbi:urea ABC transporter permease subunit UrtB [Roseovarius atlanticus]|uniref:urea ABC transporter permease subunit UrtB n=1 Tax=Roseovarius atlanticus TaxID=1641875 RepID=UPI001C97392A|nr:urea ABC transporter permease subunit UrtB [Roseovarius atlanticus]MBY5989463.1 urea ABC transporter permease subunit UrtB [Roseovarius atlanticus]MBY6124855.1 urea ABC transporter permease subunit UrtB [Roseovarius atlanticus]MBY6149350.1 urea ABC transporter permease subunit UrtB [Roseovarius atlanticus]